MEDKKELEKVTVTRNQTLINGREVDDYLDVTYFPDFPAVWKSERFTISTKHFKGFVEALNQKLQELKID